MEVRIKLYASLGITLFKDEVRDYPFGTRTSQVLTNLGIADNLVGIVLINGQHASVNDPLQSGDTLSLFPLVDGG